VVSVPGHTSTRPGNGELIAALTAQRAELPFIRTTALHDERPEAKNMTEAFDLTDEFAVPIRLGHSEIIIVDDTFHTGSTMAAVAVAARRSGATTVYGLVCARTMKK
jgi:predicted amidophosphoribosyltransferase